MTIATTSTRRTQGERRATTRRALLDATTECLVTKGYHGTTTTAVCQRAGVSQGALFRHFPTKQALLAATAEHLYDLLAARFVHEIELLGPLDHEPRVEAAVRLLWLVFESPVFAASLELELAARTDSSLRADLEPVVARNAERVRDLTAELFPDATRDDVYERTIDLLLELLLGMAISRIVDRSDLHYRRLLDHAVEQATEALRPGRGA